MPNNTERTAWLVGLVGALVLGMPAVGSGQGTVADDRAALEALYDATNGANWSRNDNCEDRRATRAVVRGQD